MLTRSYYKHKDNGTTMVLDWPYENPAQSSWLHKQMECWIKWGEYIEIDSFEYDKLVRERNT